MNKTALQQCSYGVYIVSAHGDGKLNGQIANTVCQVSSEPASVSVCINKQNLTHDLIMKTRTFGVSVLSEETPMQFIGRFGFRSGRDGDKLDGVQYKLGQTGTPIVLDHSVSYMDCELIGSMDAGTHTIFLGRVLDAETSGPGKPMAYAYYHQVKGGKSPKTAPTYVGQEEAKVEKKKATESYTCSVCGYVYNPAEGAPEVGVPVGTTFTDLPESWVCPICGAAKTEFRK